MDAVRCCTGKVYMLCSLIATFSFHFLFGVLSPLLLLCGWAVEWCCVVDLVIHANFCQYETEKSPNSTHDTQQFHPVFNSNRLATRFRIWTIKRKKKEREKIETTTNEHEMVNLNFVLRVTRDPFDLRCMLRCISFAKSYI